MTRCIFPMVLDDLSCRRWPLLAIRMYVPAFDLEGTQMRLPAYNVKCKRLYNQHSAGMHISSYLILMLIVKYCRRTIICN